MATVRVNPWPTTPSWHPIRSGTRGWTVSWPKPVVTVLRRKVRCCYGPWAQDEWITVSRRVDGELVYRNELVD